MSHSPHVCFYISDHGFGRATRCVPIIQELVARGAKITAVCGEQQIPAIQDSLGDAMISYRTEPMDVGLILYPGTLLVNAGGLYTATRDYLACREMRAVHEANWLTDSNVDVAVTDMPLWSIEACKLAEVPLQYIGNFTWAEMYREFLPAEIWEAYGDQYKQIKHALLYSSHSEEMLDFLPNAEVRETSLVARRFHPDRVAEIRCKHKSPLVFVALGMSAEFTQPIDVSCLPYEFITTKGVFLTGDNVDHLDPSVPNTQDYIFASDYVITKAGWGTVAECLLARKRMALLARDTALEDRTTIRVLEQQQLAVKIRQEDLENIEAIIKRMDAELSDKGFGLYYDAVNEIADQILSLQKESIK